MTPIENWVEISGLDRRGTWLGRWQRTERICVGGVGRVSRALVGRHGELDTQAPSDAPKLAATTIATTVYKLADVGSRRLGYIRLGGFVDREPEPTRGKGCKGQWYRVFPMAFVCTDDATIDPNSVEWSSLWTNGHE